ncbi:MAG: hypothetical protein PF689_06855, partial [Deltaproteobacteria bacterium]|nr:hypothetical protein [Deltaproteobacteria bacterium]
MARSEEELKAKFKEDPTSMEAFSGLRRMYKKAERWSDLAWLYQGRAEGLDVENRKADMFFKASKLYLEKLEEEDKGIECLYRGVILDPRHRRNSRKLIKILQERNENEKLLKIISNEIE